MSNDKILSFHDENSLKPSLDSQKKIYRLEQTKATQAILKVDQFSDLRYFGKSYFDNG